MKSVLIVTNFNAGRRKALKYKKRVINFVLQHTKSFKFVDIDELKTLDVTPFDTIFAMGGDGTVNKVLQYLDGSNKVLGIIPCGTANLLAARLGMSSRVNKTLKLISKNNIKSIDVMDINGNLSVLRCGIGWDSDIICKTPQSLKNKFGYFAYFIAGILFALRLKNKEYKMVIDGCEKNVTGSCIIFANAPNMYKNLVSVASDSALDDGLIDVFILKTTNPVMFFLEFMSVMLHMCRNSRNAEFLKAKNVELKSDWLVSHIDGEKKVFKESVNLSVKTKAINVYSK